VTATPMRPLSRSSVLVRRPSILVTAGFLLAMLAVTFKGTTVNPVGMLSDYGLVASLRSSAWILGAVGVAMLAVFVASRPRFRAIAVGGPFAWFLLFRFLLALRMLFEPGAGYKYVLSLGIVLTLFAVVAAMVERLGLSRATRDIICALFVWSFCITVIDVFLYVFQLGQHSWNGRFYGLFVHPNFLGVNQACAVAVALVFRRQPGRRGRVTLALVAMVIAGSLVVVAASGSRTGALGVVAVFAAYSYLRFKHALVIVAFLLAAYALLLFGGLEWMANTLASSRGLARVLSAGNTRTGVWSILAQTFAREPFLGAGYEAGATAGSYLRVLAMGGLVVGMPFLASVALALRRVWRRPRGGVASPQWLPLLAAILLCAVSEGFMGEAIGFAVIVFGVVASLMSFRAKTSDKSPESSRSRHV
jgi:hypothetical protein